MTSHPRDAPQFYLTAPSPCPYLPGREERKVFTHIVGRRARELNEILTQGGFRRSQTIAYRPACENCRACVSVRVIVIEFEPSGNLRRVRRASVAHLRAEYGRLRNVVVAPDGEGLVVATSNTDGRGDPAADDDRLLTVTR